jgi:hypothetical protein
MAREVNTLRAQRQHLAHRVEFGQPTDREREELADVERALEAMGDELQPIYRAAGSALRTTRGRRR